MLEAAIQRFAAAVAAGDLDAAERHARGAFGLAIIDPEAARALGADPPAERRVPDDRETP